MSLWLRELGHVIVWFILAQGCQYFALLIIPEFFGLFAILFSTTLLLMATVWAEWREYRESSQDGKKTFWDVVCKGAGILIAVRFPAIWENF